MSRTWFEVKSKTAQKAIVEIYDEIGAYGVSAAEFSKTLGALGQVSEILVLINSPGGSVRDGVAIYNVLASHSAKIIVEITGWACSVASYIAMAGNIVRMAENSLMMIHNPWIDAAGDAESLRLTADLLDKTKQSMINGYAVKSGKSPDEIAQIMAAETWFSADEALAAGFIDEITGGANIVAAFDPRKYYEIPSHLKGISMPTQATQLTQSNQNNPEIQAFVAEDKQRRQDIRAAFSRWDGYEGISAMRQQCEDDVSCTVATAKLKLLDALGARSIPIAGNYSVDVGGGYDHRTRDLMAAATDAFLIRSGLRVDSPSPAARDLERVGVVGMAERFLSMRGQSTRDMGRNQIIKAALSTSDFPELLGNTFGKAMRIGYENEPGTHAVWTAEREVPDFKKQSLIALSEAPGLLEVAEGAEYKSGYFGEAAEGFSVKTYGRVLDITRQALINDDLSAFTRMPAAFGSSSRRLEADMVYGRLVGAQHMSDGKPLFHANHGNLGVAPATLTASALSAGRAAMRRQMGVGGNGYIDPQPRFLIVPVALETQAEQLLSEIVVPTVAADASVSWIRNLQVVADPRLDADSETAWYLAASPMQIDTIVRAYLAGQPRPYYEERDEFIRDVLQIKSRHDFGVGVIDYRGLYKSPGA